MKLRQSCIYLALVWPMWGVSIGHIVVIIALLVDGVGTTTVIALRDDIPGSWIPIALGVYGLSILLAVATAMAVYGLLNPYKDHRLHILLWLPQQGIMFLGCISILEAIVKSHYLDGVGTAASGIDISRPHLVIDQWWYVGVTVMHFVYFWIWRKAMHDQTAAQATVDELVGAVESNRS